jgi:VanZ family protein
MRGSEDAGKGRKQGQETVLNEKQMKKAGTFVCYWLPPILWMTLIFVLSSFSSLPDFEDYDFTVKKAAHFMVYAFLYLLLLRAFHSVAARNSGAVYHIHALAAFVTILYAISDEIHQSFVPGRTATVRDVLVDTAGAAFMYLLLRVRPVLFSRILREPVASNRPDGKPL